MRRLGDVGEGVPPQSLNTRRKGGRPNLLPDFLLLPAQLLLCSLEKALALAHSVFPPLKIKQTTKPQKSKVCLWQFI